MRRLTSETGAGTAGGGGHGAASAAAPASAALQSSASFGDFAAQELSAEITSIEHEIEELCRQQKEEEMEMKRRHGEALQKARHKLEETKLRSGGMSPKHPSHGNGNGFGKAANGGSKKPQTQQKIMQMQAKALEGLGGLGLNGDSKKENKNGSKGSSKPLS